MTNGISSIGGITNKNLVDQTKNDSNKGTSFTDVLAGALNQVNEDVKTSEELSKQLATGEVQDLHQVTIAMEKANLGVQLTVQVRNKVVEAYQEVMRMQI